MIECVNIYLWFCLVIIIIIPHPDGILIIAVEIFQSADSHKLHFHYTFLFFFLQNKSDVSEVFKKYKCVSLVSLS